MKLGYLCGALALGLSSLLCGGEIQGVCAFEDQVTVLSETPRIFLIEHFLTDSECDYLISRARPLLKRSTVVGDTVQENGDVGALNDARTSQGMFLEQFSKNPLLRGIEKKISKLTGLPESHGEGMQILFYGLGGEYRPHYDYFDPSTPGGAACYNRGGQRIATLVMYLADTEEGGETIFPYANVQTKPIKGNAVLLYNCTPDGEEDTLSLHGSSPVTVGEKWVAVKWIRQGVFR